MAQEKTTKSAYRSIEAVLHTSSIPHRLVVTGSLYLAASLEKISLQKMESDAMEQGVLILGISFSSKKKSEKGVFNIFHFSTDIKEADSYETVQILCEGVSSEPVHIVRQT